MTRDRESNLHVEQVEEAAAAWLLKHESEQWSPADEAELAEWLQASASHRVSFMRLRSVWRQAGRLKAVSASFPLGQVPPRGAIAQSPFFLRRKRRAPRTMLESEVSELSPHNLATPNSSTVKFYGLAASILLAAVLGITAYFWPSGGPSYRTPVGGLASVPMEDGSKITLNTNSEIELEVSDEERRVNLTQGEAFFEVAKDPARPFVVYANDKRVVAVGTKFSVRLKPDAVQVIVTEGHVRVEKKAVVGGSEPLVNLVAGTIASADRTKVLVEEKALADVEQTLSWRSGYVVLRKTLLGEAVMEFNRYNRRQLVIDDPSLANIRVGGNFQSNNIDGFVRLLQEGLQIHAEERNNRIVLTRKSHAE